MTVPAHMTADQQDAYVAFLERFARRASARMREHLMAAVEAMRNPWGFL